LASRLCKCSEAIKATVQLRWIATAAEAASRWDRFRLCAARFNADPPRVAGI